jgi:hypothetical protein
MRETEAAFCFGAGKNKSKNKNSKKPDPALFFVNIKKNIMEKI